jgi:hypothetical protein
MQVRSSTLTVKNDIQFRDYAKFDANSTIDFTVGK